ncbi:EAL domain-containing protein, partial [Kluyvera georgiana]
MVSSGEITLAKITENSGAVNHPLFAIHGICPEPVIKKIIISALASGAVFSLLSGLLWLQAVSIERDDTRRAAESIRGYVHLLLEEASWAADLSGAIPSADCTEQERNHLSDIIAGAPHLHSITRIVDGHVSCSSVTGQADRNLSQVPFAGQMLSLQTWQVPGSQRDYPLLMLATLHDEHMRSETGVNGLFLQNRLRVPFSERQLWIRVGDNVLGPQGIVARARVLLPTGSKELADSELPFSVIYSTVSGVSAINFIRDWPLPLAGGLVLALIAGAACYRLFSRQSSPRQNLLRALRRGEIQTVYQPIVSSADGSIVGFEALCRWHDQADGAISPDVFIPMAEQTGLIVLLTQYQLEQIARDMKVIAPLLAHPFYVSVNFSRQHYTSGAFLHDCDHLLKSFRPLGCRMVVEITEREQLEMTAETAKRFAWLRSAGATIALDDFGTGYSNLSYITALEPDYLKIDKLFVSHMRPGYTVLLDCVIELAAKLGIHTIA